MVDRPKAQLADATTYVEAWGRYVADKMTKDSGQHFVFESDGLMPETLTGEPEHERMVEQVARWYDIPQFVVTSGKPPRLHRLRWALRRITHHQGAARRAS